MSMADKITPAQARDLAQRALDNPELFEELTLAAVAAQASPEPATLEAHISGRLSASAQRQLAQAALADDELFDALAAYGTVARALEDPAFRAALEPPKVRTIRRRAWVGIIAAAAAAAFAFAVYLQEPPSNTTTPHALSASLDPAAGKPILLARDLTAVSNRDEAAPVFRSADNPSRAPKAEGSILATDNLQVNIDLGSLDGLAKGTRLQVFRNNQPVGSLEVTTVFRDHARARILEGKNLQAKDQVRAEPAVYFAAVVEQMDADPAKARMLGRDTLSLGYSREILERLARLDYQSGDRASAEQDYRTIVEHDPANRSALNNWGVLLLLGGDQAHAEEKFRAAGDSEALNNLGVAAELRGDITNAQRLYRQALDSSATQDRSKITTNLARVSKDGH